MTLPRFDEWPTQRPPPDFARRVAGRLAEAARATAAARPFAETVVDGHTGATATKPDAGSAPRTAPSGAHEAVRATPSGAHEAVRATPSGAHEAVRATRPAQARAGSPPARSALRARLGLVLAAALVASTAWAVHHFAAPPVVATDVTPTVQERAPARAPRLRIRLPEPAAAPAVSSDIPKMSARAPTREPAPAASASARQRPLIVPRCECEAGAVVCTCF